MGGAQNVRHGKTSVIETDEAWLPEALMLGIAAETVERAKPLATRRTRGWVRQPVGCRAVYEANRSGV